MIRLHTFAPAWSLPTFTPFGLKLITHMQLAKLPFELVVEGNPGRGPRKKVPWIVEDGVIVSDSAFIVEHLRARHGDTLDGWLTPSERHQAHALRRMVEEGLCFAILHTRWVDAPIYRQAVPLALAGLPRALHPVIAPLVRRRILRDLWGQGIGRFNAEQAGQIGCQDLDVIAARLAAHPFAMGDRPSSLDAVFDAFLRVILDVPLDTSLKRHASRHPQLGEYLQRIRSLTS